MFAPEAIALAVLIPTLIALKDPGPRVTKTASNSVTDVEFLPKSSRIAGISSIE
jgi:hypothetical protein